MRAPRILRRVPSFRALVVVSPIVAYAFFGVLLHRAGFGLDGGALILALWITSPVLWWTGYALLCGRGTSTHRGSVILLGIPLLVLYVGVLLSIDPSPETESLAPFAWFLVPPSVLFWTVIASVVGFVAVRRANRRDDPGSYEPGPTTCPPGSC